VCSLPPNRQLLFEYKEECLDGIQCTAPECVGCLRLIDVFIADLNDEV